MPTRIHDPNEPGLGTRAAAAFRQAASTQVVTLPSGIEVRLKKPDLIELITGDGDIPDVLTGLVMGGLAVPNRPKNEALKADDLRGLFALVNVVAAAAFVEPHVVDKPDDQLADDEIRVEHLDFNDRVWVLNWTLGKDGAAVNRFPGQQASRVDAVPAGADVRPDAE